MRIAQVAPLMESVPPRLYGGTERVVSYLTEELAALGHDVTLFASGDSVTRAALDPACGQAIRLDPTCRDSTAPHLLMLERVARRAREFDIIHFHTEWLHLPLFSRLDVPFVTTLHGRLDGRESRTMLGEFGRTPLVSISDAQRKPAVDANWLATVHHGLPSDLLAATPETGSGYLAFLGRISPEKQPDAAIRIALASGRRIRIAAKVDPADEAYFQQAVLPLLGSPRVQFLGEIGEAEKSEFLGNADALLFPIAWPEPFGMVLIEAASCGTPVIAFGCGSVPEVIEHGVTGFIVHDEAEAIAAVGQLPTLSRAGVRNAFQSRFTSRHMAEKYLDLYAALARKAPAEPVAPGFPGRNVLSRDRDRMLLHRAMLARSRRGSMRISGEER
jgi:glycosyltransferase involved in cell wall biosynthesis